MDARRYLAQKGLDGKAASLPQRTLEEKAWARARKSGQRRPRAGTPHDWEDWERYHEELADGAEQMVQKVDSEEHSLSLPASAQQDDADTGGEASFSPAPNEPGASSPEIPSSDDASHEERPRAQPFAAFVALAVVFPPLAVGLSGGGARRVAISLLLTLLGWLPGIGYALYWLTRR
jgi:uncharacterized membrane protein YqaE (UPF0057 family)